MFQSRLWWVLFLFLKALGTLIMSSCLYISPISNVSLSRPAAASGPSAGVCGAGFSWIWSHVVLDSPLVHRTQVWLMWLLAEPGQAPGLRPTSVSPGRCWWFCCCHDDRTLSDRIRTQWSSSGGMTMLWILITRCYLLSSVVLVFSAAEVKVDSLSESSSLSPISKRAASIINKLDETFART